MRLTRNGGVGVHGVDVHGVPGDVTTSLTSSEADTDSALYSMEDLPRFTKSTAKLELQMPDGRGSTNEAV